MPSRFIQQSFLGLSFFVMGLLLWQPTVIFAQDIQVPQDLVGRSTVYTQPVTLSPEASVISGRGEPGARVTIAATRDGAPVYSTTTVVNRSGQWQANLPGFSEPFPNQLMVSAESDVTVMKTIEKTTVTSVVGVSGLVLFQLVADRVLRFLQLVGLLGRKITRGYVYDVVNKKPIAFAILTIERLADDTSTTTLPKLQETVVSTVDGFFKTISLPHGKYRIHIGHPNYEFPTKISRPWYASPHEFYQGEILELGGQSQLSILFAPMQPRKTDQLALSHWLNFQVLRSLLARLAQMLSVPMALLSVGVLLVYPSFINFAISSLYMLLVGVALFKKYRQRVLRGVVTLSTGERVAHAVVRIFRTLPDELVKVMLTEPTGQFVARLPQGQYRVMVAKDGFVPVQQQRMSVDAIDLSRAQAEITYQLTPAQQAATEFDWSVAPKNSTNN